MKMKLGVVTGLIASLVLFVAVAIAQQSSSQPSDPSSSQPSDPSMQQSEPSTQQSSQSGSQSQQAAMQNPDTIKQVQQALSNQGYDAGPSDGKMGAKTKSALKKFQESKGMQASGQLDQQTMASLGVSGSAAGGQESMQDSQSGAGAGGQQEDMQKQESSSDAQQQEEMPKEQSDEQPGSK